VTETVECSLLSLEAGQESMDCVASHLDAESCTILYSTDEFAAGCTVLLLFAPLVVVPPAAPGDDAEAAVVVAPGASPCVRDAGRRGL